MRVSTSRVAIEVIISFLAEHLEDFPAWSGTLPDRNEDYYNQRLDRFLGVRARKCLDAFLFGREIVHEPPGRHDIGVFPAEETGLVVRGRAFGPCDPIYTIECKRLPQPPSRRREYLTSEAGEKPRGAVQRYKLCIHGAGLDAAGIIGYVQDNDLESWLRTLNGWIGELIAHPVDTARWTVEDRLKVQSRFKRRERLVIARSESARVRGRGVGLTHFLMDLRIPAQTRFRFDES